MGRGVGGVGVGRKRWQNEKMNGVGIYITDNLIKRNRPAYTNTLINLFITIDMDNCKKKKLNYKNT